MFEYQTQRMKPVEVRCTGRALEASRLLTLCLCMTGDLFDKAMEPL